MITNSNTFGLNQIRVNAKFHPDLTRQEKSNDRRRRCRKKVGESWMEEKKNVEVPVINEKKGKNLNEVESTDSYGCQICGKEFKRKSRLKFHLIHHNKKTERDKYQCVGCDVRFKKEKDKHEHELECERNESHSFLLCCFCDLQYNSPKELRIHENQHRPLSKTKRDMCTCVFIDCREAFDSVSSLRVHMQRDHKSDVKLETITHIKDIIISAKQEYSTSNPSVDWNPNLHDVSDLLNQEQCDGISKRDELKNKPASVPVHQTPSKVKKFGEKPFTCSKCGSRYKYEKSRIKHELKYHASGEMTPKKPNQNSGEVETSQQVSSLDEFPCLSGIDNSEEESIAQLPDEVGNIVHADNNNIIPVDGIKRENGHSLTIVDVSVDNSSGNNPEYKTDDGKQLGPRSHPNRQSIIKKRCIGCDKVFEGLKERDEHELKCSLNYFNKRFNCMFCDHPFGKPKALRKHENKHRPVKKTKKYKNRCVCIECNKTFDAIYSLRVHMKKLHRKDHVNQFEKKPFSCSICDARFKYENSKFKHEMRYHRADLVQKIEYSNRENVDTIFTLNVSSHSDDHLAECKKEKNDLDCIDTDNNWIKEEPEGNLCSGDSQDQTEKEVYNPVNNVKTEADAVADASLNHASGGEAKSQTEETYKSLTSSSRIEGRKRKARKPVEKKTKKQKTGPYVCNNCEAKFNSPQGLWLHSYHQNMRTKRLSCIGCGRSFKSEKETEEHELKCDFNHNKYDFNCMFCDEQFRTPKLLRNHELQHRPRRRTKNYKCVCISCRKPFDSIHSLKKHIKDYHKTNHVKIEHHGINGKQTPTVKPRTLTMEEMMSCYVLLEDISEVRTKKGTTGPKICKSKTKRIRTSDNAAEAAQDKIDTDIRAKTGYAADSTPYNVHVNIKEGTDNTEISEILGRTEKGKVQGINPEFPEDVVETPAYLVEMELSNQEEVVREMGTASFDCGKCNAKFDSLGRLRYHSYSHRQRTRKLFCIGCGVGFEQSNDRDRHELECDVNLTNGHFSCIFCELPFDTPQSLRNHENKHRPPKRYKRYKHMCLCAECDRAFDAVFTLKIHIRHMHRGSKEKVKTEEEIEEADDNFGNDLTFEEYKFDNDLKVEKLP